MKEYRTKVYDDVDTFFKTIHDITDKFHKIKRDEVDSIFQKLRIDDLSDMDKYAELY